METRDNWSKCTKIGHNRWNPWIFFIKAGQNPICDKKDEIDQSCGHLFFYWRDFDWHLNFVFHRTEKCRLIFFFMTGSMIISVFITGWQGGKECEWSVMMGWERDVVG